MQNVPGAVALGMVSDPNLQKRLTQSLPDYDFHWGIVPRGCVMQASDLRPSIAFVDLDQADKAWQTILLALKTNNATRRIPFIGFTDDPAQVDIPDLAIVMDRAAAPEAIVKATQQHARLWDADYYAAMQAACQEMLPPNAQKGIQLFNAGDFWEAHEALEHAWIDEQRPVRDLYRAILQVGVAYYQIQQGNYRGAIKMFLRAVQWLDPLPDVCQGVDVRQFKQDAAAVRAALEALSPETIDQFDQTHFKPINLMQE